MNEWAMWFWFAGLLDLASGLWVTEVLALPESRVPSLTLSLPYSLTHSHLSNGAWSKTPMQMVVGPVDPSHTAFQIKSSLEHLLKSPLSVNEVSNDSSVLLFFKVKYVCALFVLSFKKEIYEYLKIKNRNLWLKCWEIELRGKME